MVKGQMMHHGGTHDLGRRPGTTSSSFSSQSTPHLQLPQVLSMTPTPATRVTKKNCETGLSTVTENINCHPVAAPENAKARGLRRQRTTTVRLCIRSKYSSHRVYAIHRSLEQLRKEYCQQS